MDLKWLDDFRALARTRHFSRAADEQNVSQPTFSRRIKLLEESVGVMLIDRNSLPLSLTPAGKLFLEAAERIGRDLRETKDACLDLERVEAEKLRFATNQTLYLSFFQSWRDQLGDALGEELGLDINLNSTGWIGEDFVRALQQDECDLVLCYWHPAIEFLRPLESDEFECHTLARERLIPVSAADEQGQARYRLPGSEREPLPYIGYNASTFLSPVVADHLRKVDQQPQLLQVNLNSQAISVKAMISQGYGVGWLPQRLLEQGGEQGLVKAGDQRWEVELELRLYRQRNKLSPRLDTLWQRVLND
jgi:DNA-binding transcriptional LysR family regulator